MPNLSDETPGPDEDRVTDVERALIPYGATNGDPDHVPQEPIPTANRRRKPRQKKAPVAPQQAMSGYVGHIIAYRSHQRQLRMDAPIPDPVPMTTGEPSVVHADPAAIFGSTGRPVYRHKPGHAYPMDAETFAKWKAKYGRRAEDQIGKEAQLAIDTGYRRYFADGGTEWQTTRTVPAIEREVRAYCEKQSIPLESFYDPEQRRWFKYWTPMPGQTLPAKGRIEALTERGKALRIYRQQCWDMREFSLSDLRSIEGDVWRDMNPEVQRGIVDRKYTAYKALLAASDWHDDLLVVRLKLCDQLMFMNERMMTNVADTGQIARWELRELVRDNDDTEIPIVEIERKQARIDGLKTQWWDCWAGFQAAKRLRAETVAASPIEWSAYRSIEQRAKDRANVKRLKGANSHGLSALEAPEQFDEWQRQEGYLPPA